jgi:hypothetical protein
LLGDSIISRVFQNHEILFFSFLQTTFSEQLIRA